MGKYVVTKNEKGKYHFNLVAGNGEIILSSQMYSANSSALKGINSIVTNAKDAPIEDQTADPIKEEKFPKFVIKEGKDHKFYFSLFASNGKAVGSSEGYNSLSAAKAGITSVKKNSDSKVVTEDK